MTSFLEFPIPNGPLPSIKAASQTVKVRIALQILLFERQSSCTMFKSAGLALAAATVAQASVYSTCSSFGEYSEGNFHIYQNLFGASDATSGSQCLTVSSAGSSVAWSTKSVSNP